MPKHILDKYNLKSCRKVAEGLLIVSNDLDEWLIKDTILLHRDNRNKRGNISFHRQCTIKSNTHALRYISSHSKRYSKPPRQTRLEKLFELI